MSERPRLGFVGLGGMGTPMARHLLGAGYELRGWNRSPERVAALEDDGCVGERSPRAVAEASDVVFVSLFDDDALRTVLEGADGVVAGAHDGLIVVETSTVLPATSAALADQLARRGATLLRAPVSGNTVVAEAANLAFLCSGPREAYERCVPLLELLGASHRWLGPGEEARAAKLALAIMIAGTMELIGEALATTEAAGIERRAMLELMGASAVGSPFVAYKTDPLVADDFSPTFSATAMRKDLRLVFELSGRKPPAAEVVDRQLAEAERRGWGERDFAVLALLQRDGSDAEPH